MATTQSSAPPPDPLFILRGHSSEVNHVRFHRTDNDLLLSGGADGEVKLWRLSRRRTEFTISHTDEVLGGVVAVDSLSNGDIVSQGRDGFLKVWDVQQEPGARRNLGGGSSNLLQIEPKISLAVELYSFCKFSLFEPTGGGNAWVGLAREEPQPCIEIWDVNQQKLIQTLQHQTEKKLGLCMQLKVFSLHNNGDVVVAAVFEDGSIHFWSMKTGKEMFSAALDKETVLCFDINKERSRLVCGTTGTAIGVFNMDLSKLSCEKVKSIETPNGGIASLEIRSDQKIFATAGWDSKIRIFHMQKLAPLAILHNHTSSVHSLSFSPHNPSNIASAGKDKRIALWSIY